ncbi:MAG: formamidopyrimidine-DNA glycosylase, partial [Chloroflexi bacterium]
MPELPEVETIAADLRPHLLGRTIVRCDLRFPTIVRHPEPETFVDLIAGLRIES